MQEKSSELQERICDNCGKKHLTNQRGKYSFCLYCIVGLQELRHRVQIMREQIKADSEK